MLIERLVQTDPCRAHMLWLDVLDDDQHNVLMKLHL